MPQIVNYTEFFRNVTDIFVTNLSNCQVSVSFDIGPGHSESFLFPNSHDPINLTRFVPFDAIKNSMDFRRMLNRSPPALRLLTEQEYRQYFERQSQQQGLDSAETAMDRAEAKRMAVQNHMPLPDAPEPIKLHEVTEDGQRLGEHKTVRSLDQVSEQEEINPRVLHLCLQVHPSVPDQSKMTAASFLNELDLIPNLTLMDWDYIQSHGSYYKSVKGLARKKIAELSADKSDIEYAPELPSAPKSAKKLPKKKAEIKPAEPKSVEPEKI